MPYASRAQQRFLHARHPGIARRWDDKTSKKQFNNLPERKRKKRPMRGSELYRRDRAAEDARRERLIFQ